MVILSIPFHFIHASFTLGGFWLVAFYWYNIYTFPSPTKAKQMEEEEEEKMKEEAE
jgi:hypothetical protein